MFAKEKSHGIRLMKKCTVLTLCLLLAFSCVSAGAEPEVLMYAADGRTLSVNSSDVEAYKAVGWYTTRQAAASAFPDLSSYGSNSDGVSQPTTGTVYRGRTGTKYHRSTCPTLKRGGAYPMSLSEALSHGRTACKVCKP